MDNKNKIKTLLKKLGKKLNANVLLTSVDIYYSAGKRKTNKRFYINAPINGCAIFGKFPADRNDGMVVKEANILKKISTNQFSIPKVVLKVKNGFFMSAVAGAPVEIVLKGRGLSKSIKILEKAVKLIANFHQATEVKSMSIKRKLNIYSELTGRSSIGIKQRGLLEKVSIGYMHGDLDPFNMFFDVKTGNYGLIDWEDFTKEGFQELDVLHFLIMAVVILYPGEGFTSLYEMIFLHGTPTNKIFMKLLSKYCQLRKKNMDTLINLLPIYCDFQIKRLVASKRDPSDFIYPTFKKLFLKLKYEDRL